MRKSVAALVLALSLATLALVAPAAGATKKPDPCKVFKTSEIADAFGGTVGTPTKGLSTAVNATCSFDVGATATRPKGTFHVTVMFIGAKAAYTGLKSNQSSLYQPISGLSNSLYAAPPLSVVNLLKGDILLGVQGIFIDTTSSLRILDVKDQLVTLAKIGIKRV